MPIFMLLNHVYEVTKSLSLIPLDCILWGCSKNVVY